MRAESDFRAVAFGVDEDLQVLAVDPDDLAGHPEKRMQDCLIGLLDGQGLPQQLRRAHVDRLVRPFGHVPRIEDERVGQTQGIDDLVEHPRRSVSACLAVRRDGRGLSQVSRLTASSRFLRS